LAITLQTLANGLLSQTTAIININKVLFRYIFDKHIGHPARRKTGTSGVELLSTTQLVMTGGVTITIKIDEM
jgi:hypothetical protein